MKKKIIPIISIFFFTLLFASDIKLFKVKSSYIMPSSDKKEVIVWDFIKKRCDFGSKIYTFKIVPEVKYVTTFGEITINVKSGFLYSFKIYKKIGGTFKKYERDFKNGTDFFIDSYGGVPLFLVPHKFYGKKSIKITGRKEVDPFNSFLLNYEIFKGKGDYLILRDLNHKKIIGKFKYGNFFWWSESNLYNIESKLIVVKYESEK